MCDRKQHGKFFFVHCRPKRYGFTKQAKIRVGGCRGKWQQTYHVRPVGSDGSPAILFPHRSVGPPESNPSAGQHGGMGDWNFQPENWSGSIILNGNPAQGRTSSLSRVLPKQNAWAAIHRFRFCPPTRRPPTSTGDAGRRRNGGRLRTLSRPGVRHVELAKQKEARARSSIPIAIRHCIIQRPERPLPRSAESSLRTMPRRLGGKALPILAFPDVLDHKHFLAG